MGVWYCRACREENFGDSRFCEACGGLREEVASATPLPPRHHWVRDLFPPSTEPQAGANAPGEPIPAGESPAQEAPTAPTGTRRTPTPSPFQRSSSAEAEDERDDAPADRQRSRRKVRLRFLHLGERLKGLLTRENYREVLADRRHPATTMLIAFVAWGIFRMVGFAPLMFLLRVLAFLMGPFGLVVVLAVAYVYGRYHKEIDARVATMRRRARAFRTATTEAARSMGWIGRALGWLRRGSAPPEEESRGASRAPSQGTPVRGATVRILDEEDEG